MISSVGWVRSGAARSKPIEVDDDEEDVASEAAANAARAAAALSARAAGGGGAGVSDDDEEEDPRDAGALPMFQRREMMFYRSNDEDPLITLKDDDEDDSDADDLIIQPTDKLVLAARSEEDVSNIEVHVYEEENHNLYTHHDIMLPSFPLALEWLGARPAGAGGAGAGGANLVAVGTFEPQIEIWDLDVLATFAPVAVLGEAYAEPVAPALGKKKGGKKKGARAERAGAPPDPALGHTDAVMGLAWNRLQTNALASASADRTVRIWDLGSPGLACVQTLSHHADKVQAVCWHPSEPSVLLSGSFDKTAAVVDVRAQNAHKSFALGADVEALAWASDTHLLVTTEDGHVSCYDARASGRVWTLSAHDSAATGLTVGSAGSGVFATCSTDKVRARARCPSSLPRLGCGSAGWSAHGSHLGTTRDTNLTVASTPRDSPPRLRRLRCRLGSFRPAAGQGVAGGRRQAAAPRLARPAPRPALRPRLLPGRAAPDLRGRRKRQGRRLGCVGRTFGLRSPRAQQPADAGRRLCRGLGHAGAPARPQPRACTGRLDGGARPSLQ